MDGASIGNPGPAGIGVVIRDPEGKTLAEISEPIGNATNNVAEYRAVIRALKEAEFLRATRLALHSDSELLVRQLMGTYRVKSEALAPLFKEVVTRINRCQQVRIIQVSRELNREADRLATAAARRKPFARQNTGLGSHVTFEVRRR